MENKEKNMEERIYVEKALEGAAAEGINRFGSAVKQHYVAYSGVDNEVGKKLKKGLKSISEGKLNPNYKEQNIKQQAGFAAEVKAVARKNADNIVNKNPKRTLRTDDLGRVNDTLYDLVDLDVNGKEIVGSGVQMKFVGSSPNQLLNKLKGKKFEKYLHADALLGVADDDYDALIGVGSTPGIIEQRINKLKDDIVNNKEKADVVAQKKELIEKYKKIKRNLRKTGLTREEAIKARLHPKIETAKDVAKLAHNAGKEQIKYGAIISGSVSIIKNVVACVKGEKKPEDAAASIAGDTVKGAGISYATAFSGTLIKGALQNSASEYARSLSKTNFAAGLVTTTLDVGRTMRQYIKGDITGVQCVEMLGEHGVGEIGSAMFATIGMASVAGTSSVIIPIIASLTGATLGYAAATAVYQELVTSLKEYELAKKERIRIEKECEEAIKLIRQYRSEMNERIRQYFTENIQIFDEGFKEMDKAIVENDINGFIKGNISIQEVLGKEIQYKTQEEFDDLMLSDVEFKL